MLFAAVFAARLAAGHTTAPYSMFYTLPIALIAIAFGRWAGLTAGLVGIGLVLLRVLVQGVSLSLMEWTTRAVPLLLLGTLLGVASDRIRRSEHERRLADFAALLNDEATEVNDTLVQGMAAAKWLFEAGKIDQGIATLEDTTSQGHQLVSRLIRRSGIGPASPTDDAAAPVPAQRWKSDSARELQGLLAVTEAISGDLTPGDQLALLLDRVRSVLRVDSALVLKLTPDGTGLTDEIALGVARELADRTVFPVGEGFAGRIAATREPLVVEDLRSFPVYSPVLRRSGLRALAGVPLVVGDRLIGVLQVGSKHVGVFNSKHVPLLREIGSRVATRIEVARREEALNARREWLATIVDTIIDPLWITRPLRADDGTILDILPTENNRAATAAHSTPVGARVRLPERSPELFAAFCRVAESGVGETLDRVYVGPHPDGQSAVQGFLDVRLARLGEDIVVSWRDVTPQVEVEQMLRRQAMYGPADRPAGPVAGPRPAQRRTAAPRATPGVAGRHVPRHRPIQGRQRLPRPRGR